MGSDSLYQHTCLYKGRQFCVFQEIIPVKLQCMLTLLSVYAEGESCTSVQEWGAPTVAMMLGFGYDCSWEKAEENTCSLGIEAGDAADGWEESCPLCAQGAWLHS